MKLLYITNQISGPGGLERVLSVKASHFSKVMDHEVHILTLNDSQETPFFNFHSSIFRHNLDLKKSAIPYTLGYLRGIKKTIADIKPDIVLVCDDGLKGMVLPRLISKRVPMVYERHVSRNISIKGDNPTLATKFKTKLLFKLMEWGGSKYDAFVVLTHGNLREWNLKNLKVIPNPLSFVPTKDTLERNKTVIAVGKHSFQKGYDLLIDVWRRVSPKFPEWKLEIYGTKHSNFSIEPLISKYNLESSVHLYNPTQDIEKKFKKASIHVLSSRFEGFGMVITEAMACGIPSIAFDCPHGPSDIITDNFDGILVDNGNIVAMAMALEKLMGNETRRKEMGINAKESINRYRIDNIAKQWDGLFNSLVDLV